MDASLTLPDIATGPDVTPLGPFVTSEIMDKGWTEEDVPRVAHSMLYGDYQVGITEKDTVVRVLFLSGHQIARTRAEQKGPIASDVMVIGKMPWKDEMANAHKALASGASGVLWKNILAEYGVNFSDWYVTNICRFMPPFGSKTIKASWVKECRWFLDQEIHLVKPKYLLLMGSDAIKAVMGRVMKITSLAVLRGATNLEYQGAKVWAITHPAAACAEPALIPQLTSDLLKFSELVKGKSLDVSAPTHYRYIKDVDSLRELVDFFIASDINTFSLDCEWGGTEGSDYRTGKLRTLQFSHASHYGYCVILRGEGLVDAFKPNVHEAILQLRRLFCRKNVRLIGHNLREDLKWLQDIGINLLMQYYHGFDTMLAHHLLYPSDNQALETLALKYTDLGRYDFKLREWVKAHGYKERQYNLYGYAYVPDEILLPYSCGDVDVCIRAYPILKKRLQETKISRGAYDLNGVRIETLYDLYREIVHAVSLPLFEIETTGIHADRQRLISSVSLFLHRRDELVIEFRKMIHWPEFNFRSVDQCREFLFGKQPGKRKLRPPEGMCLDLIPTKTTGKPSMDWERIALNQRKFHNPSTDAETLKILAGEREEAHYLQQLRFVDQVIKNFLRPAEYDPETGEVEFTKGLISVVDTDERVRTSLSQLTETGRYRSARPNMQNLPKAQESELRKLFSPDPEALEAIKGWAGMSEDELKSREVLHPDYYSIRSCFMASPGHVLIEADYRQAEMFVLAYLSGDANLIAVLEDPDRDLHSENAVNAFHLKCGMADVKKLYPSHRVMAKAVGFGISYGRGAAALVREIKKEGVDVTVEETQMMIDTFYSTYPKVYDYVEACKAAVENPGYVETAFGRRRTFHPTNDDGIRASQERQATNQPIQGTVADALSVALMNLWRYKRYVDTSLSYRLLLPVHDAVIVDAHWTQVEKTVEVMSLCMSEGAKVPHIGLTLYTDIEVSKRWNEHIEVEGEAIPGMTMAVEMASKERVIA